MDWSLNKGVESCICNKANVIKCWLWILIGMWVYGYTNGHCIILLPLFLMFEYFHYKLGSEGRNTQELRINFFLYSASLKQNWEMTNNGTAFSNKGVLVCQNLRHKKIYFPIFLFQESQHNKITFLKGRDDRLPSHKQIQQISFCGKCDMTNLFHALQLIKLLLYSPDH